MLKKTFLFLIAASIISATQSQPLTQYLGERLGQVSMFSLPQRDIDHHFAKVKEEVDDRWKQLSGQYDFPPYSSQRDEASLVNEFYQLSDLRMNLWLNNPDSFPCESNPLFKISQDHLANKRYRQACCVTFEHSATSPFYNSSSIEIGKRRFFALEGPTEELLPNFFHLLTNWNVAQVVCLTNEDLQSGVSKCHPYWEDYTLQTGDNNLLLSIPVTGEWGKPDTWGNKNIPYLFWGDWKDHHGVDPEELVLAANKVRENTRHGEIIAVHCSAGVGRTGTFISAVCLLDAIDEQLAHGITPDAIEINIARLFLYLNFHRPWLVAKPSQYLTLYRTAEWYLNKKKGN